MRPSEQARRDRIRSKRAIIRAHIVHIWLQRVALHAPIHGRGRVLDLSMPMSWNFWLDRVASACPAAIDCIMHSKLRFRLSTRCLCGKGQLGSGTGTAIIVDRHVFLLLHEPRGPCPRLRLRVPSFCFGDPVLTSAFFRASSADGGPSGYLQQVKGANI